MMIGILILLAMAQAPTTPVPAHPQQPPPAQAPASFPFEMRELNEAESAALPPGEGREAVAFMCVPCHGVLPAIALRKTALGWATTVEDMRVKGAKGSDEQAEAAARYLSQNFAAVNVNSATADELMKVAGLSGADAAAIVAFRSEDRPFKSYADLKKVPGLDTKRLAAAKPRLVYTPK
jgi:competence ComEA-like helix-hairpin-helix protein